MPDTAVQPGATTSDLAAIVAEHVPLTILGNVVAELGLIPDFDVARRSAPSDPMQARKQLAAMATNKAAAANATPAFVNAILRRLWQDAGVCKLLWPFREQTMAANDAQQAAIALRAHTMRMPELLRRLADWEKWICVVAAVQPDGSAHLGTGILVAADLVLTAYHTVRNHIADGKQLKPSPGPLYAIFDHTEGEPVTNPEAPRPGTVLVPFADDWLMTACEDAKGDGTIAAPTDAELADLKARLDFVVIRLKMPIGRFARAAAGGPRRSWLNLAAPMAKLRVDDRIVIPQHPAGAAQRIDFGRFMHVDPSLTRLRYSTETDHGTSGAPCFSQNFELVGLHNASFQPGAVPVANQAVQIDCILPLLQASAVWPLLGPGNLPPAPSIWSVSLDPTKPRVVLSRQVLLSWIEQAASNPARRAERVYAARCRGNGPLGTKGFGKSFTVDILRAARRETADPIVVLGTRDELLPATAPDVIRSIADQLGIPPEALETMPKRPADSPTGPSGSDKLLKWASEEIPHWFDRVLAARRQVVADEVAEAKEEVALLQRQARPVPADLLAKASKAEPIPVTRSRWDIVWIAIDRLDETRTSDEVWNLLAGLVGGKLEEAATPPELRRLRWLFIGYVPDFLTDGSVTPEILDPMQVDDTSFVTAMQAQASAVDQPLGPQAAWMARAFFKVVIGNAAYTPPLQDPNQRLILLQILFPELMEQVKGLPP